MPRALILGLLGLVFLGEVQAQTVPVWTVRVASPVKSGVPFDVTAEVRLPAGYYQDADSDFLAFEPVGEFRVTGRSSSTPVLRAGKSSFTGTFTLTRTLVLDEPAPSELTFRLGWQICKIDGVCLLPAERTQKVPLQNVTAQQNPDVAGGLLAAFLGGLLLNLMPCVFPVLALKGLGMAAAAHRTRKDRRREALAFAAGSFSTVFGLGLLTTALALFGQRLDWGFPFQQPLFVWFLALTFAALTLQLWGIWQPRWSPFKLSTVHRGGLASSWAAGAFLVLAAAPCTAPLLGPALGFALSRPPLEIPLYFAAIGLGLAAPLLVLQAVPEWSRVLPKPGPWMNVVERFAGGFLALTAAYLLWVVSEQVGTAALGALLGLALFCASLALRKAGPGSRSARLLLAGTLASPLFLVLPHETKLAELRGWKVYSAAALNTALAEGRPVLIDATAAWCATCQVNELAVLNRPETTALMDELGLVRLRADYTRPDPAVHEWLTSVERAGLPVYALYRPGKPLYLFPELLNEANFNSVLRSLAAP